MEYQINADWERSLSAPSAQLAKQQAAAQDAQAVQGSFDPAAAGKGLAHTLDQAASSVLLGIGRRHLLQAQVQHTDIPHNVSSLLELRAIKSRSVIQPNAFAKCCCCELYAFLDRDRCIGTASQGLLRPCGAEGTPACYEVPREGYRGKWLSLTERVAIAGRLSSRWTSTPQ